MLKLRDPRQPCLVKVVGMIRDHPLRGGCHLVFTRHEMQNASRRGGNSHGEHDEGIRIVLRRKHAKTA